MTLAELSTLLIPHRQSCPGPWAEPQGCSGKGHLILRFNRTNREVFWGCSTWPHCIYGRSFNFFDLPAPLREAIAKTHRRS